MEIPYDLLLKKAAAYSSKQEVCSADIEAKLQLWGADADQSEKIVSYLVEQKYIDNERFCSAFVNDKLRFNKWGKLKITQALRMKKIPDSLLERVFSEMDVSLYEQTLSELLRKKVREVKAASDYERRGKLLNFALQRGFEYDVADRLIKKMNL
ncbi:regulatory protein RecX [Paludibacter sp.]|uniref:regulatory protein RecX n=1 Tax=Paludibacter sp. TaxID=1898105 RepID=UPI001356209E|nr:regulatory protein RecX [Paludibacter sp.]MTK53706.1 RecX family transcriptional regulator [Paludibacter sp.]